MKIKEWFKSFLAGMGIGVASAIPGVSGGTIAVILNVYEKIILAIANIFKKFKNSFLVLLPVILGVIVALIPSFFILKYALDGFVFGIICLFAGLIIGSYPGIFKEVKGQPAKKSWIVVGVITFIIAIGLGVASVTLGDQIAIGDHIQNPEWWFYLVLIPVGMLASIALIVPGISGSMLLLIIGFYKPLLQLITGMFSNFTGTAVLEIVCFAIGVVVGIICVSKLMGFLLGKYHFPTYYGIIGFIIGSTITLFFNYEIYSYFQNWATGNYIFMPIWLEIILGIILLVLGCFATYHLSKHASKKKEALDNNEE